MLFSSRKSPQETVRIYCPVCSTFLGNKKKGEIKSFDCPECKHTFYFYAFDKQKPKGIPIPHKIDSKCNCGRCGR